MEDCKFAIKWLATFIFAFAGSKTYERSACTNIFFMWGHWTLDPYGRWTGKSIVNRMFRLCAAAWHGHFWQPQLWKCWCAMAAGFSVDGEETLVLGLGKDGGTIRGRRCVQWVGWEMPRKRVGMSVKCRCKNIEWYDWLTNIRRNLLLGEREEHMEERWWMDLVTMG